MSTTGAKKAVSEWVSKREAEKMLGISERQLERRCAQGYLEKKLGERSSSQNRAPVFYLRADVEALKAGKPNVHAVSTAATVDKPNLQQSAATSNALAVVPRTGGRWVTLPNRPAEDTAILADFMASLLATKTEAKPWLTLDEAVEYSGLPKACLLSMAREGSKLKGEVVALNVGTEARARWRFSRTVLGK